MKKSEQLIKIKIVMCSILGHVNYNKNLFDEKKFVDASDLMRLRGPDAKSYLSDNSFINLHLIG